MNSPTSLQTFPIPSLEQPFGISLWPLFNDAFEAVVGYPASNFQFVEGKTPLSGLKETSTVLVLYYTVVLGGRRLMREREPLRLKTLFLLHNLVLSTISAILLGLFLEQLVPTIAKNGLRFAICNREGGWTQPMALLYYMNYLIKYVELLDTAFLFLRKKPLTFLHCYHHGATVFLCYTQLIGTTAISWVVITLNLAVHVVMYWYYFQTARGIRIWWKAWVTRGQILQFVIALSFISYGSFFVYFPQYGFCVGSLLATVTGDIVISSYLVLFVLFYLATYRKGGKTPSARIAVRHINQAPNPVPHLVVAAMSSGHDSRIETGFPGAGARARKV
ncbi:elongation of very long chain fatty acids protein [Aspergillus homomorphus CBS 101889]|uniref:Elongation of fatty acids protein n=1 Tax=Aspergillus homomorphus (strain CBS 101889) TaxID=1450537 RepID=A0A395I7T5_ASPHC|nr:elongation of fatty acids protein [Aspergillus homomorphus CBS 101889]RAL15128.1 elongation of fatty acids protein [Aspergillus homomorphus CBS 101889]